MTSVERPLWWAMVAGVAANTAARVAWDGWWLLAAGWLVVAFVAVAFAVRGYPDCDDEGDR